jgi:L-amino acid N-acyltransferase YncA
MKIIRREIDPTIIEKLKPYFIEDGCYTRDLMGDEFERSMRLIPDTICVLVSYNDDKVSGFLIAHECENRDYAYFAQAYSRVDGDFAKEGLQMLVDWARSRGLKELRAETERNSAVMRGIKQYEFTEHSIVMTRRI